MTYRILHIFDHSIPLHSGYTFRSRAILREQRARGWDTLHVTGAKHFGARAAEEEVDGLRFHRTKAGWLANIPVLNQWDIVQGLARRIEDIARREHIDILHAHSPCLNGLAALRAGRRLGLPVVYEVRAFWEDAAVDHGTCREGDWRYRLTRALETRVLRQADRITCICEGLRQDIVARGIPAEKITVISNAVDIDHFPLAGARDAELEASLGLAGKRVLGFIGSFYGYEGLEGLLDALPAILEQAPDLRLLLVGGGPRESALKAKAEAMGLADKLVFTGRVPHREVPRYASLVDIFVFPRRSMRLTELVTPLKPLESMAQGKLVLASDVGGHRELIQEGKTGALFRADDAADLARAALGLLAQPERWPDYARAGRQFVETERNWAVSVANYEKVYRGLSAVRNGLPLASAG
ncbi:MAG: glycosyltransferase, exosortase A system-associated [Gammaproteobacteria bacterium]|nr:glycosyltransferase, exosortase A system-associated [Gammaproteobacteria bacterium]